MPKFRLWPERNSLIHLLQVLLITPLKLATLFLLTIFVFYLLRIQRLNCSHEKVSLFLNSNLLSMKTLGPFHFLCFDVSSSSPSPHWLLNHQLCKYVSIGLLLVICHFDSIYGLPMFWKDDFPSSYMELGSYIHHSINHKKFGMTSYTHATLFNFVLGTKEQHWSIIIHNLNNSEDKANGTNWTNR